MKDEINLREFFQKIKTLYKEDPDVGWFFNNSHTFAADPDLDHVIEGMSVDDVVSHFCSKFQVVSRTEDSDHRVTYRLKMGDSDYELGINIGPVKTNPDARNLVFEFYNKSTQQRDLHIDMHRMPQTVTEFLREKRMARTSDKHDLCWAELLWDSNGKLYYFMESGQKRVMDRPDRIVQQSTDRNTWAEVNFRVVRIDVMHPIDRNKLIKPHEGEDWFYPTLESESLFRQRELFRLIQTVSGISSDLNLPITEAMIVATDDPYSLLRFFDAINYQPPGIEYHMHPSDWRRVLQSDYMVVDPDSVRNTPVAKRDAKFIETQRKLYRETNMKNGIKMITSALIESGYIKSGKHEWVNFIHLFQSRPDSLQIARNAEDLQLPLDAVVAFQLGDYFVVKNNPTHRLLEPHETIQFLVDLQTSIAKGLKLVEPESYATLTIFQRIRNLKLESIFRLEDVPDIGKLYYFLALNPGLTPRELLFKWAPETQELHQHHFFTNGDSGPTSLLTMKSDSFRRIFFGLKRLAIITRVREWRYDRGGDVVPTDRYSLWSGNVHKWAEVYDDAAFMKKVKLEMRIPQWKLKRLISTWITIGIPTVEALRLMDIKDFTQVKEILDKIPVPQAGTKDIVTRWSNYLQFIDQVGRFIQIWDKHHQYSLDF